MKTILSYIAVILLISSTTYAENKRCSTRCDGIDEKRIRIAGIQLLNHSFEDVFKIFGNATIYMPNNHPLSYVCYTSSNQTDTTAIVFTQYSVLEDIEIFAHKSQVLPMIKCTKSHLVNKNMQFDSGLKLFIEEEKFNKDGKNELWSSFDEISTYECCTETTGCEAENKLYRHAKFISGNAYYIHVNYTGYCSKDWPKKDNPF